jgi:hypothetical protein
MKLLDQTWNTYLGKFDRTWLADSELDIPAGFDPESAEGSIILVILPQVVYIKNSQGKWQKMGTSEVLP